LLYLIPGIIAYYITNSMQDLSHTCRYSWNWKMNVDEYYKLGGNPWLD
jgi:hypothetical protein